MKKKLRILKKWLYEGQTYEPGAVLTVEDADDAWVKGIVDEGYVKVISEEPTPKKESEPTPDESKKTADPPTGKEPLTRAEFDDFAKKFLATKAAPARPRIEVIKDNASDDPRWGYKSSNEFFVLVKQAGEGNGKAREELISHATKAVGADEYATVEDSIGGFLIPPEYRTELLRKEVEKEFVMNPAMGNAMVMTINSTMLKIPVEVDVTRTGDVLFGGVTAYRTAERTAMTASRGKLEQIELKPEDLTGLCYVTDNMLYHSTNLHSIIGRWFRDTMQYKRTGEFMFGSGVGNSLGAFHASNASLTTVTRGVSGAITTDDVLAMRTKCYDYDRAIWMAGTDTFPAIMKLAVTVGVGGAPVMLFNMATQDKPATLLGRPIVFSEFPAALGTANDLLLASWPHYIVAYTGRVVNDSSIHVRYESNETAFRFIEQMQGMPWWRTTLTLRNSVVVSPFVALS